MKKTDGLVLLTYLVECLKRMWILDPGHAMTLVGPRAEDSKLGVFQAFEVEGRKPHFRLAEGVQNRPIRPVEGGVDGAQAFQADIEEIGGRVAARPLSMIPAVHTDRIRCRWGAHGAELFLKGCEYKSLPTRVVTFIVGPDRQLWAWYPGPILPQLSKHTAIKLT